VLREIIEGLKRRRHRQRATPPQFVRQTDLVQITKLLFCPFPLYVICFLGGTRPTAGIAASPWGAPVGRKLEKEGSLSSR
jgi:hypothetical protein